jgi:hypothetical protein
VNEMCGSEMSFLVGLIKGTNSNYSTISRAARA